MYFLFFKQTPICSVIFLLGLGAFWAAILYVNVTFFPRTWVGALVGALLMELSFFWIVAFYKDLKNLWLGYPLRLSVLSILYQVYNFMYKIDIFDTANPWNDRIIHTVTAFWAEILIFGILFSVIGKRMLHIFSLQVGSVKRLQY